jgi:hypothetical protein
MIVDYVLVKQLKMTASADKNVKLALKKISAKMSFSNFPGETKKPGFEIVKKNQMISFT